LSRAHGWSCDTVVAFEIVLADGSVVNASATENADLWLALKGSSFNFGIITQFTMETYELDGMWAGTVAYNATTENINLGAVSFSEFMAPANFDPLADMTFQIVFAAGQFFMENALFYSAPIENPATFQPFMDIPSEASTLGLTDIVSFIESFGQTLPAAIPR
jgi:hypothetical protein